MMYFGIMS